MYEIDRDAGRVDRVYRVGRVVYDDRARTCDELI